MRTPLRALLDAAPWLIAPGRCVLCGLGSGRRCDLCQVCEADLPAPIRPCPRCGLPMPPEADVGSCGRCLRQPPRFDRLHAACSYADPADLLVAALKFQRVRAAARVMAEVMWSRLPRCAREALADAVLVPVPLHPLRQWRRGFNQSRLLAEGLARCSGWPVLEGGVRRVRSTRAQSGLSRSARRRNLSGAFQTSLTQPPPSVILVDDVVTTGATLDALTLALRRAGVDAINAWTFARTPPAPHI